MSEAVGVYCPPPAASLAARCPAGVSHHADRYSTRHLQVYHAGRHGARELTVAPARAHVSQLSVGRLHLLSAAGRRTLVLRCLLAAGGGQEPSTDAH